MTITPEYQDALLNLHKQSWGNSAGKYAGDSIVELLNEHPEIKTILDYGCGEGTLKDWVEDKGIHREWTLYDPGMEQYKEKPSGKFDLVITTDVLEHVEELMLNRVLAELRDYTGKFLYNEIACYFCGVKFEDGPYIGRDLHINMKAPDMWAIRLQNRGFETILCYPSLLEGWKVRSLVIQERINK